MIVSEDKRRGRSEGAAFCYLFIYSVLFQLNIYMCWFHSYYIKVLLFLKRRILY
ncbi:hypothetical protein HMPREF0083_02794 [Aneurinibacillus aneurinilyticus ATCC 12856]|uniref:Uncharacterized protein n=1 Tax=Aneurinibacillus aneurinilyticus ATCC 12856 TaxID=649747 RepID=U1WKM2_ANEAE|nr:hypothetical protein HMPREF0083_02794 [Aneurinibacillus aneurinilyticus ATCC 12856]